MQDLIEVGNSPKEFLKQIPKNTGIYKFLGSNKDVLYVGKAKNLNKRLNSYFRISKTSNETFSPGNNFLKELSH